MAKDNIQPTEEQIRTRAYYLWEADGRPQGRDWEYWLRAKEECATPSAVKASNGPAKKASAAVAAESTRKRAASRAPAYA